MTVLKRYFFRGYRQRFEKNRLQITVYRLPPTVYYLLFTVYCLLLTAFLSACGLANPPRLATATAQAAFTPTPTLEPLVLSAATPTAPAAESGEAGSQTGSPAQAEPNPSITVWVNETSASHEAVLDEMAAEFSASANIDVNMVQVSPLLLPDLVNTAVLSNTLPDIILHPLEFSVGWAEEGVFNTTATAATLAELGSDTFDPDALALVQTAAGQPSALPSSGFHQLIIYRQDWFSQQGLATPNSFQTLFAAAEATHDPENLISGFVVPTEANLVTTQQIFEQMALANSCELVDDAGEIKLLEPACAEALSFYFRIINQFSPIGVQTDTSTRNAYLAGRTGLIMGPPSLLPQLAGLDPAALPSCPECAATPDFLAQNSGILTQLNGTAYSNMTLLGITQTADAETAVQFATYWFNEGYTKWLAVEPERKVPLRWGTSSSPRQFIDSWGSLALANSEQSLEQLFGAETMTNLRDGIATASRWGFAQGQGQLVTTLYEELTLSIVLQEMLSGYFSTDQSIIEAYNRVVELIPNYAFPNLTDDLP